MDIVLYMGGCCGDIITGLIDTKGVSITSDARCAVLKERARLKRGFEFENDAERDTYIQASSLHWKSLPSHDTEYHIRKQHDNDMIIDEYQTFKGSVAAKRASAKEKVKGHQEARSKIYRTSNNALDNVFSIESKFAAVG